MQVVVDVVPVALGVLPPPQREVGVLQEQRAIQHTLLVNLGPEQEDLHAAGHDAGVDVLLVVVVAKRETQDDRTRTSTLHLFFLNTDKSASDRDSLLQKLLRFHSKVERALTRSVSPLYVLNLRAQRALMSSTNELVF